MERISWRQTRARLQADRTRLAAALKAQQGASPGELLFHPAFVCVLLHRLSHYSFAAGHRYVARFLWHLNVLVTGADISEPCDLGEGLVILSPPGVAIMGKAGRNLTMMPCAGLGGELGRREDVGAGPGLPALGDDVVLGPHCGVLGPVTIGHRVRLAPGVVVTEDVPDDTVVTGSQPRFLRRGDLA
jgi:serine O-acetyltransferase